MSTEDYINADYEQLRKDGFSSWPAEAEAEKLYPKTDPVDSAPLPERLTSTVAWFDPEGTAAVHGHTSRPQQEGADERCRALIDSVTGPTGGWLISPKEFKERLSEICK